MLSVPIGTAENMWWEIQFFLEGPVNREWVNEMREQREISEEIGNLLAQTTTETHDEDSLNELNNMQREELDEKMLQTGEQPSELPDVPTQLPAQAAAVSPSSKKDEEELDKLKKWA